MHWTNWRRTPPGRREKSVSSFAEILLPALIAPSEVLILLANLLLRADNHSMDSTITSHTASSKPTQTWNTEAYAANGRFVATLATDVVALLAAQPDEHILDLGCGDGALTQQLVATGAILTGVDASPAMLAAACERSLRVEQHDATALRYHQQFDAVFSNAALHWIPGLTGQQAA